jgi:predicted glutamine amidotransferase
MMLSDGTAMFAHCSTKLCYVVRQYPFDKACLADEDLSVDFSQVTTPERPRRHHRHHAAHDQRNLARVRAGRIESLRRRLAATGIRHVIEWHVFPRKLMPKSH